MFALCPDVWASLFYWLSTWKELEENHSMGPIFWGIKFDANVAGKF